MAKRKTEQLEFGRFAQTNRRQRNQSKPETFDFLGFTHICGEKRSNKGFALVRHTVAKQQRQTLHQIKQRLMQMNQSNIHLQGKWLRQVVRGYINYFGVPTNTIALQNFRSEVCRGWRKALRRRGNKRPMPWAKLRNVINFWIPSIKIVHPYPSLRWCV